MKTKYRIRKNNSAMIQMLPSVAFSVILLFSILYIGTYITGTISSQLVASYPNNFDTWYDDIYYHNATTSGYRNTSITNSVADLTGATSGCNVNNNGSSPIWFNLTTNGFETFNQTITAGNWVNTTVTALIASGNLSTSDTTVNFSWSTNASTNRIRIRYYGSYLASANTRTALENQTVDTLGNLTGDYDNLTEIVAIAAIVVVLTVPLMAVVALKRLF